MVLSATSSLARRASRKYRHHSANREAGVRWRLARCHASLRVSELPLVAYDLQYTEGRGADAIIITAPGRRPFMQALAGVRKGGTINIFAAHSGMVPINLEKIYQQELSITSTYSSSPEELRIALGLLTSRKVRVDGLISHRLPLTRFAEGVMLMRERAALKVYYQISGE